MASDSLPVCLDFLEAIRKNSFDEEKFKEKMLINVNYSEWI